MEQCSCVPGRKVCFEERKNPLYLTTTSKEIVLIRDVLVLALPILHWKLKSRRIQEEKSRLVFITKWSWVEVLEVGCIFGDFCLCCLWCQHSKPACCPWADSVPLPGLLSVPRCVLAMCLLGSCLVCSRLESGWQQSHIQGEQQGHGCKTNGFAWSKL